MNFVLKKKFNKLSLQNAQDLSSCNVSCKGQTRCVTFGYSSCNEKIPFCFCYKPKKLRSKTTIILSAKFCDENCIFPSIWSHLPSERHDTKAVMFASRTTFLRYTIYNFCDDCGKRSHNEIVSQMA